MSKNKFENNLSEGSIIKQLLSFSMPFLISNIIQSLYNVADMLIVGNFSGTNSMSGVNIGGQITLVLTNIVIGLATGGSILIAQSIGANDRDTLKKTTQTLMTTLGITGIVITVVMLFLKDPVLKLISTPEASYAESSNYLTITLIGVIFIFTYNVLSAVLRGMGDSKRPLIFVTIACVVNIALDFILVAGFKMGASGAAIATVASQALSVVLCIMYMKKHDFVFDFKPKSFKIYKDKLWLILKIGLPNAVQNGVIGFSFIIITTIANIIGGVEGSAAVGVVGKINGFAIMPGLAMSASISNICAQNIGANKWSRAIKTCKLGLIVTVVISYLTLVLVQVFPREILMLFNDDPKMIEFGVEFLRMFSLDYLFTPFTFCIIGLFIANGHTTFSLFNALLSSLVLRVPFSYLFGMVFDMGAAGIGLGAPIASLGSLILVIIFLISGKWKTNLIRQGHISELSND